MNFKCQFELEIDKYKFSNLRKFFLIVFFFVFLSLPFWFELDRSTGGGVAWNSLEVSASSISCRKNKVDFHFLANS